MNEVSILLAAILVKVKWRGRLVMHGVELMSRMNQRDDVGRIENGRVSEVNKAAVQVSNSMI